MLRAPTVSKLVDANTILFLPSSSSFAAFSIIPLPALPFLSAQSLSLRSFLPPTDGRPPASTLPRPHPPSAMPWAQLRSAGPVVALVKLSGWEFLKSSGGACGKAASSRPSSTQRVCPSVMGVNLSFCALRETNDPRASEFRALHTTNDPGASEFCALHIRHTNPGA